MFLFVQDGYSFFVWLLNSKFWGILDFGFIFLFCLFSLFGGYEDEFRIFILWVCVFGGFYGFWACDFDWK